MLTASPFSFAQDGSQNEGQYENAGDLSATEDSAPDFELAETTDSPWTLLADLRSRDDRVNGLPEKRADLQRFRWRARVGGRWDPGAVFSAGAAVRLSQGDDVNRDNARNNDNERSDDAGIDQAWLRWRIADSTSLELGKAPLPLVLTPMLWDPDLRPVGASFSHSRPVGAFDRWQWDVGAFDIDHPLQDGARLLATQWAWHAREGAPVSYSASAAYLFFDRIDPLIGAGLARRNPVRNARYVDDYRLLDLQFALKRNREAPGNPLEIRFDLARNLSAARAGDAARLAIVRGDPRRPGGWTLEYAYQRIQFAAVLAAVNSDDWWFHAGTRGHMATVAYRFDEAWSLRAAGFSEKRDGSDRSTHRILLDVIASW